MAERSFREEVKLLRLGDGDVFRGEGILAITKALLQSGVAYVGGYQGAPISHLMDVLADANDILADLGVHFEASANEATAAAMLGASVHYPLRGAVAFKSVVGTNVASDALSNLSSAGVDGGALIIVGEDYGEGSSIMQERSHAFAMKSQIWLLDPRPHLPTIVKCVEQGFALSEASNTPVMLELRIRTCHMHGRFTAKDNIAPEFTLSDAAAQPRRDVNRVVLPPASFMHERDKVTKRWPAAVKFIQDHQLNEFFAGDVSDVGIIMQGGMYNGVIRALEILGLADLFGRTRVPLYVLNAVYPLVDDEIVKFARDKKALLIVEEGQPEFIEQSISTTLRRAGLEAAVHGKDVLPMAGEYTGAVMLDGVRAFIGRYHARLATPPAVAAPERERVDTALALIGGQIHPRPPSFCTGCPERPMFSAMKLVERELGTHHVATDIGCHLFSVLPPFNIGAAAMGYGLGGASASAWNGQGALKPAKRVLSVMGDGGFWHNGLASSIGNAVFNKSDNVFVILDNGYTAATGGQDIPSSHHPNLVRSTQNAIMAALRGIGVSWSRFVKPTYDVRTMVGVLRDALTTPLAGPKVIVAQSECMLNRQRRERPARDVAIKNGERVVRQIFGVDADLCTGDRSCIRLSGCPSLTIVPNPDPLRGGVVTTVTSSCVGCGLCGNLAHADILCPSFYRMSVVNNPNRWDRLLHRFRSALIDRFGGYLERRLSTE